MNRFLKTSILSLAVAASTLAAFPAANAGERYYGHHRGSSDGDMIAAGILGLAVGAIAAGALSQPRGPVYDGPAYDPYAGNGYYPPAPPARRYDQRRVDYSYGGLEPWSREWYRYCKSRYRSFDSRSGTFVGHDGREHFCVAR